MHFFFVRAQQQVALGLRRQEVVRVAPNQRHVDAQPRQQLRRHHPQQIRPRRGSKQRRLGKRELSLDRTADLVFFLQDDDLQPGARQKRRCHQTIVPRPDDYNLRRKCGFHKPGFYQEIAQLSATSACCGTLADRTTAQ